jgi:glycosyltransferase involved in cell wall biosynthesis
MVSFVQTPVGRPVGRVLVVHNAYQYKGGEDSVVEAELELLQTRGHRVEVYSRDNDELAGAGRFTTARDTLWSPRTMREMAARISAFQPDVIHVHNTFPLISPSVCWAAARADIPLVQTLHNFRLLCASGMLLRDGRVCEDCLGKLPWRGVVHRCYRGSAAHSAMLVAMLGLHRALRTYQNKVARYIALSEFSRAKLIEGGLPAHKISVKPNFVTASAGGGSERKGGLFVGRLAQEKGIALLLAALDRLPGVIVDVIGSGPEAGAVAANARVRHHGRQEQSAVLAAMRCAAYLVLPSITYENFPRTIVEAFACGLPVIASRLGALAEIVEDTRTGLLFGPGSPEDLAQKIAWAEANPAAMRRMGENARREYELKYTAEINYQQLMRIYQQAVACVPGSPVQIGDDTLATQRDRTRTRLRADS